MNTADTCRLEIPTAVIMPNITRNMPPMTGVGMLANIAPTFPKTPLRSMVQAPAMITMRLPTWGKRKRRQLWAGTARQGVAVPVSVELPGRTCTSDLSTWCCLQCQGLDTAAGEPGSSHCVESPCSCRLGNVYHNGHSENNQGSPPMYFMLSSSLLLPGLKHFAVKQKAY